MSTDYLKKDTEWEMLNYDKKGKLTGMSKQAVVNTNHSGTLSEWEIKTTIFDKKKELIHEGTSTVQCEDGVYKMDMSEMMPAETLSSLESMKVTMEGTQIDFPTSLNQNTELEDGEMTITGSSGFMSFTMKMRVINRKIEGVETIETEAGTFECLKISQDTKIESKLVNKEYATITWFLPGFGAVRTESYNHKDKLMGYSELGALKN
ncbi:hypothetical protein CW751_13080 [Brumimicrobium salinarum]|uniref:DUF3108 domain-containing protein n=2 Tax=Brumimicrobium salinarum TaxID=2058658 RepID=A0A2I0QZW2_9FLAO|nr:hypothetical protein CW751_13080 [Brumimicrobium salinarum]